MKYGIAWYVGDGDDGEHDYRESGRQECNNVKALLKLLYEGATEFFDAELLFEALRSGQQDTIFWITDDFGFAFYIPSRST